VIGKIKFSAPDLKVLATFLFKKKLTFNKKKRSAFLTELDTRCSASLHGIAQGIPEG